MQTMLFTVVLAIIAFAVYSNVINVEKVQASDYTAPVSTVKCKTNSDCSLSTKGKLCVSINGQESFCGCVEDLDCDGTRCIYNVCQ